MAALTNYLAQMGGAVAQPTMQGAHVSDAVGQALTGLSGGIYAATSGIQSLDRALKAKEDREEIQSVTPVFAEESIWRYRKLDELRQQFPEGGKDFVDRMNAEFDPRDSALLAGQSNQKSRAVLQEKLFGLKQGLTHQAVSFQGHSNVASFENEQARLMDNSDPASVPYGVAKGSMNDLIDSAPVDRAYAEAHRIKSGAALAEKYTQAEIIRDPYGMYERLRAGSGGLLKDDMGAGEVGELIDDQRPWVKDLPEDRRRVLERHAFNEMHRAMNAYRVPLVQQMHADMTFAAQGKLPDAPLTEQSFKRAFPAEQAAENFHQYSAALQNGKDVQQVQWMRPEEARGLFISREAQIDPAFPAGDVENLNRLKAAYNSVVQARARDPQDWAEQRGYGGVAPYTFKDTATFGQELQAHQAVALDMEQRYGVPLRIFSDSAAASLKARIESHGEDRMGPTQQLGLIKVMGENLTDPLARESAAKELNKAGAPELSVAMGLLLQKYRGVTGGGVFSSATPQPQEATALTILTGMDFLKRAGTSVEMPSKALFLQPFDEYVGSAFGGQVDARESVFKATMAYYAGVVAPRSGMFESKMVDGRTMKQAMEAVVGGVSEVNGERVFRPHGMPDQVFRDSLREGWQRLKLAKELPESADFADYKVLGMRGGYVPFLGGRMVTGRDGSPLVLSGSEVSPEWVKNNRSSWNWFPKEEPVPNRPETEEPALPQRSKESKVTLNPRSR